MVESLKMMLMSKNRDDLELAIEILYNRDKTNDESEMNYFRIINWTMLYKERLDGQKLSELIFNKLLTKTIQRL